MKKFKHSGTLGDLVYSLALVKHFGGGHFFLHLNQVDWIGQHYYGSRPTPFHQGRMTQQDYEFMKPFMLAQDYITDFKTLDTSSEVTHNLDRFRPLFVGHPGNYLDIYAEAFGIRDPKVREGLRNTPWLTVPRARPIENKPYVINRTERWLPTDTRDTWDQWRNEGVEDQSVFVGLPEEYRAFKEFSGWDIEYVPTTNMLELAEVIAGAEQFVGNQSVALSMAIGLGVDWVCEQRKDLPMERNECYFPDHPRGDYF
jgi:hypothetical protein